MQQEKMYFENTLNLLLFRREEPLKSIITSHLDNYELEKGWAKLFIDIFALDKGRNLPVFVEVQIKKMDEQHQKKIFQIYDAIEEGIIVWISKVEDIQFENTLKEKIMSSKKPVEMIIAHFDEGYLFELDNLRQASQYDAYQKMLSLETILPSLTVRKIFSTIPENYQGNLTTYLNLISDGYEKVNNEFLSRVRKEFPYYTNIVRAKANLEKRQIQIGSGISRIEIVLVPSRTNKREAQIMLRTTNRSAWPTLEFLKNQLRKNTFTSKTSEEINKFTIHYDNHHSGQVIEEQMISDLEIIIRLLCNYDMIRKK